MDTFTRHIAFTHDANSIEQAREYIKVRAKQLLRLNYVLINIDAHEWGVSAFFTKDSKVYQSIYILKDYRNQGIYKRFSINTILTSVQCNIADYLHKNNIDCVVEDLSPFDEYNIISSFYGENRAKRTGIRLMNHIDEGLAILEWIGSSSLAKKAYTLHPLFQNDTDLLLNHTKYKIDSDVMLLVMEYRSIANEYLSTRKINSIDEIRLSPLVDVTDMLIADKVQNYKDFELYHKDTHIRSADLIVYFDNWLRKLNISDKQYQYYKSKIL